MTRRALAAIAVVLFLSLPIAATTTSVESAYASYSALLAKYVTPRGVRYTPWRGSGDDLKSISGVVAALRGADAKPLSPDERKAIWINLYNAKVIELVLLGNPKSSIRDLSKGMTGAEIFDRKSILYLEKGVSLNDLEKMLQSEFKDPRVHFALHRATRAGPPPLSEAYTSANLETQLDEATRAYLAHPGVVTVKTIAGRPTITATKVFERYAESFKAGGGPLPFLAKYGPEDAAAAAATGKAKLEFAPYDWGLDLAP